MKKLILVNSSTPFTSVYKMVLDTRDCVKCPVTIVNLQYSNRSGKWAMPAEGTNFRGLSKNVFVVNVALARLAFRKATRFIARERNEDTILHYTHQNVWPLMPPDEKTVIEVHDNPETSLSSELYVDKSEGAMQRSYFHIYSRLMRRNYRIYSKFPNVLVHSDYVKDSLIDFGFEGKITIIYSPVTEDFKHLPDTVALRKKLDLPLDKKLVLSVSSPHHRKNLDTTDRVVRLLGEQYKLVRIGRQLRDSITFMNIPADRVNELYNACDVLLIPSLDEGFGIPVAEALTIGLPVVASNISVFQRTFGDNIIMRDPYDVSGLAEGVKEAIDKRDQIAAKGIEYSKAFSIQEYCRKINDYYSTLLP